MGYGVFVIGMLKGIQDWIQADSMVQGEFKVFLKTVQEHLLVVFVERIYNFICKADKTVNIVNLLPDVGRQHFCSQGKRGTVPICDQLAAAIRD